MNSPIRRLAASTAMLCLTASTVRAQPVSEPPGLVSSELPESLGKLIRGGIRSSLPGRMLGRDMDLDHGTRYVPDKRDLPNAAYTLIWLQRDGRVSGNLSLKYRGMDVPARFDTKLGERRKWGETYYYRADHPVAFRIRWRGMEHVCRTEIWLNIHPRPESTILQGTAPREIERLDPARGCVLKDPEDAAALYVRDSIQPRGGM